LPLSLVIQEEEEILAKTLGFYQNIGLDLHRLSMALECVQKNPTINYADLAKYMGMNKPVAESYSAWLRHTGLVVACTNGTPGRSLSYQLTPFGERVVKHDPKLADLGTQWLLHYYLAVEHEEISEAWRVLINRFIFPGLSFNLKQFQSYFSTIIDKEVTNKKALERDPEAALYTYIQAKALGKLGILRRANGIYTVGQPIAPDTLIAGYVLFDHWQRTSPYVDTWRFSQICQEAGNVGRIFLAQPAQVRQMLADLAGRGYVTFAETQHEPVNRLYREPVALLLERYYHLR
jgi:predicted transcriptional regulator